MKSWLSARVLIPLLVFGFALTEATARWGLGLGTPPLLVEHPTIEYMFAPNQDVSRFGNRQLINALGMRSEPLERLEDRRLVLVFGDSVLNGGNLTDHKELATTLATDAVTFFGNVSAGSWGPGNYRAWLDEFGLLGARSVIFVLSNHDLNDQPTFSPLDPTTHPTETPRLALSEAVFRYLPRYLPSWLATMFQAEKPMTLRATPVLQHTGIEDMETMFYRIGAEGASACIIHHPTQSELAGDPRNGKLQFDNLAASFSVPSIDLAPIYLENSQPSEFYRVGDEIHINAKGQFVLSKALRWCAERAQIPKKPE